MNCVSLAFCVSGDVIRRYTLNTEQLKPTNIHGKAVLTKTRIGNGKQNWKNLPKKRTENGTEVPKPGTERNFSNRPETYFWHHWTTQSSTEHPGLILEQPGTTCFGHGTGRNSHGTLWNDPGTGRNSVDWSGNRLKQPRNTLERSWNSLYLSRNKPFQILGNSVLFSAFSVGF